MNKLILTFFAYLLVLSVWAQDSLRALDVQQCIQIAIDNNLTMKRSRLLMEQSKINLNQSRAAQLPSLNLNGNYGAQWGRGVDPTTNDFITEQINFTGVGGSANVTLFNWFRITNSIKQNRLLYESSEYDVEKAKNDISLRIVTLYLNVILNSELEQNAQYQLSSSEEQLARTKKLVAGGALPRTNELELVSQVATNEVNLINAQNNLDLAILNLKQAMLIPSFEEIQLVIPDLDMALDENLGVSAEEVYAAALKNMPEIQSAEIQVESAAVGVNVAESGYSPSLSLNGSFRTNYSNAFKEFIVDPNNPFSSEQRSTNYVLPDGTPVLQNAIIPNGSIQTVGFSNQLDQNLSRSVSLNLNIPIFNNLQAKSSVQRAKINLQQAEIVVLEQKNALRQTIETSYNDAQAAGKTYQASLKQVLALEETFRSIENQYNLGAANFTDYQVASNNLFRAKSDMVRAKYDYIFKRKILDFYQGKIESL